MRSAAPARLKYSHVARLTAQAHQFWAPLSQSGEGRDADQNGGSARVLLACSNLQ
jgi:hypothetical protein